MRGVVKMPTLILFLLAISTSAQTFILKTIPVWDAVSPNTFRCAVSLEQAEYSVAIKAESSHRGIEGTIIFQLGDRASHRDVLTCLQQIKSSAVTQRMFGEKERRATQAFRLWEIYVGPDLVMFHGGVPRAIKP